MINFKWYSMQIWKSPIYKSTLKSFVWSSMNFSRNARFCLFKLFFLHLWDICKSDMRISCLYETMKKFKFTHSIQKNDGSSTFFIRLTFQMYCCESGIVIFARRVIWNCGYSPLNSRYSYLSWDTEPLQEPEEW